MTSRFLPACAVLSVMLAGPAWAQGTPADSGVRDILNRAQSQSERRAVDDLINRLKTTPPPAQPGQPAAPAAASQSLPATGQPTSTPAPAQATAPPAQLPAPAAASTPQAATAAPPVATAPATPAPAADPAPSQAAAPASSGSPIGAGTGGASQIPTVAVTPVAPASGTPPAAEPAASATGAAPPTPTPVAATPDQPRASAGRQRRGLPPSAATTAQPPADGSGTVGAPIGPAAAFPTPIGPPPGLDAMMEKAPEIAREKGLPTVDIEVLFEFDSAEITPGAAESLAALGKALSDPQLAGQKFVLAGHTDRKGRAAYNLALSERRAQAVRAHLVTQYKIPEGDLLARGFGHTRLKNPRNPAGPENRRVQIINFTTEMVRTQQRR